LSTSIAVAAVVVVIIMSTSKKQEVMDQVRQELAMANAQELIGVRGARLL
jgi:hypothetical protein